MSDHIHKCTRTSHPQQSHGETSGSSSECCFTGIWHVTYNAENKRAQSPSRRQGATAILRLVRGLTSARARSGIPRHSGNCYRPILFSNDTVVVEMAYDYMGRRFEYKETVNNTLNRHERYLYRGFLQLAALDMLNNASVKHCIVWDPTEPTATRPLALQIGTATYYYSFDQVKNVTELFDGSGALAATYDYSPFGQVTSFQITQPGNNALTQFSNPLTFSSEIHDSTLGLQYYNYRHLNTLDGRWVNRDSIGEDGDVNIYGFVANDSIDHFDFLGNIKKQEPDPKPLPQLPPGECKDVSREEFEAWLVALAGKGIDKSRISKMLDDGCVGVTCFDQNDRGIPEGHSPTKCWLTEEDAKKDCKRCAKVPGKPCCSVWAKQGIWNTRQGKKLPDGSYPPPKKLADGSVSCQAVQTATEGKNDWNYILAKHGWYFYANHSVAVKGPQRFYICKKVPEFEQYPAIIWGATCVKKSYIPEPNP